ncbi:carbon-nitrogen hydrolase [Marinihelvus fidelis]|uniref:Carbon-nitrogen hydrolase n=1 Tax=Marinihelvus fidelis TaxID=2613842 RepID=A0A5N0TI63_9GAMM|nr:carbon-nitrogen hydrolase [Marinihelvus fidelis]KAA9134164.1 carbon-nitrogen hydrolase [Marinihelvus fidelis]
MAERLLKAGFVQMSMGDDVEANTTKALAMTREAIDQGAKVVCLPELFRSRYFCQTEDDAHYALAEAIPGATTDAFAALAAEHDVAIVASLFEARAPGLYHNTTAVLDGANGYAGKYRKMHIPDDPRYYEKYYFTPGDLGFRNFSTRHGELGVLICWDQWYPEAARATALLGSEILFYPTAIGWHPEEKDQVGAAQHQAWQTMQRSHAIANGCYVMAVNRMGFEPDPASDGGIEFWGRSFIAAPDGTVVIEAPADEECVLVAELDLSAIARQRHGWPFFRDRRIDAYENIGKRFARD